VSIVMLYGLAVTYMSQVYIKLSKMRHIALGMYICLH